MTTPPIARPPETLEGWYVLHQILRFKEARPDPARLARMAKSAAASISPARARSKKSTPAAAAAAGWSCVVRLVGSTSDLMAIHFRESIDAIGSAQDALSRTELGKATAAYYSFLSV